MNIKPLVSIILPTHNRASYISTAIESALSQSFKDFELIIINDGSTDKTSKIISEFEKRDSRVRSIANKHNLGLVKSLNKGIKNANGKYIARIDDDDFWCESNKLEKQTKFLDSNPEYVLVGGGAIITNKEGKEVARVLYPEYDEDIRKEILFYSPFAHPSIMFRKDAWGRVGGYDEELFYSEDWDLWMKFGRVGKFHNLQEYFLNYLQGEQNRSNNNIRRYMRLNLSLRKRYRNDYLGFRRAYLLGWAYYLYFFLPRKNFLHPLFSKLRRIIFPQRGYTYLDHAKN